MAGSIFSSLITARTYCTATWVMAVSPMLRNRWDCQPLESGGAPDAVYRLRSGRQPRSVRIQLCKSRPGLHSQAGPGSKLYVQGTPHRVRSKRATRRAQRAYHNNGNGTFSDVSQQAGILKPGPRYGLGVVAADFDNDGYPDIYVACDMTPSLLYHNLRNGKFEERAVEAGVAYNFDGRLQAGMGLAVADYDGTAFSISPRPISPATLHPCSRTRTGSSSLMFRWMRASPRISC